jgi:hypothetical protein
MTSGIIRFIEKVCVQTAVYWGNPSPDGRGGNTYDTAVEIACRWEQITELVQNESIRKEGKEIVAGAKILLTQDVALEGYLYLGSLDDLSSDPDNPLEVDGAREIIKVEKVPLFKSTTEFVREAYVL